MTEKVWLGLNRPHRLLRHVEAIATRRRLRLLMVACHRRSFPFQGPAAEAVLRAVEGVADGVATAEDVATLDGLPAWDRRTWNGGPGQVVTVADMEGQFPSHRSNEAERAAQCDLIRDIFGNPFRPAALSPDWRTETAAALARQMYAARDFAAMPILADALQDVGCDNEDILGHCRGQGPHVRGCWVCDLVLGKE